MNHQTFVDFLKSLGFQSHEAERRARGPRRLPERTDEERAALCATIRRDVEESRAHRSVVFYVLGVA